MATKRTTTVTEHDDDDAEAASVLEQIAARELDDELSKVDALVSEFRGVDDTSLSVFRQGVGKNNLAFLFSSTPDDMGGSDIMEKCRDEYGGGDFRMHVRDNAGLVRNVGFSVEAPKEKPEPEKPDGLGIAEILAIMQTSNDRMMTMFTSTMATFAEAFKGGQNQQPQFNPIDAQRSIIESVAALKGLTEDKRPPKDPIDMLVQGVTLAKEIAGKDGETNSSDILLEAIKQFAPTITTAATRGGVPGSPQIPAGPSAPVDPQAEADAQREVQLNMRNMVIKGQVDFLVNCAKANKDPELYAELLLDQVGPDMAVNFVNQPDAMDKLVAINAEVLQYRIWFEELKRHILEMTTEDSDESPTPGDNGETGVTIEAGSDAIPNADNDSNPSSDT